FWFTGFWVFFNAADPSFQPPLNQHHLDIAIPPTQTPEHRTQRYVYQISAPLSSLSFVNSSIRSFVSVHLFFDWILNERFSFACIFF
ncbi:unnamed protein product, partial [Prunus brigantina]